MGDFGHRLKAFRQRMGREWTQERLGYEVGVSRNTISNWESGNYLPSRDKVLRLAQHLVLSPLETDQLLLAANYPLDHQKEEAEQIKPTYISDAKVERMVVENLQIKSNFAQHQRDFGRRDYYAYISLPPHYVLRSRVYEEICALLLKTDVARGTLTSTAQYPSPTVLHGVAGTGKSALARALCEDEIIQAAFPDGILWATLGQEPDLLSKIGFWVKRLGGIIPEAAPTLEQVKEALDQQLRERQCLLIVDDVWRYSHVEAFRVGGPGCQLLLTTRKAEIADKLGIREYHVPVMEVQEAIELLEAWTYRSLMETPYQLKEQLVRRLGFLPLAIKLAGPQFHHIEPLTWLQGFKVGDLEYQDVENPHDSLRTTFELSMKELKEQDQYLYIALAVFKEDETIPFVAIVRLWHALTGFDEKTIWKRLNNLISQALIDRASDRESIQLHDLLRDFLVQKLGYRATTIHQILLDAYRQLWLGSGWHTAPDDGYLYDHLAFHLHQAGRIDELRGLFATQEWLRVRVPQKRYTYDGYLADLSLAWQQAEAQTRSDIERNIDPSAFSECIRYALIQAGIHSLVGRYIPEVIAQAVALGVWKIERVISVLEKMLNPEKRVKLSRLLLQKIELTLEYRQKIQDLALEAVLQFSSLESIAEALAILGPQLPEEPKSQILNRVLKAALQESEEIRARVLMLLAPQTPEEQRRIMLQQAWKLTLQIEDVAWEDEFFPLQSDLLEALFPLLSGKLLEQALEDALLLGEWHRGSLLVALAPRLSGELLKRALNIASQIGDEEQRMRAFVALVPQLSAQHHRQELQGALDFIQQVEVEWKRARTLRILVPQLSGELLEQAWGVAKLIKNGREQADLLVDLAPKIEGKLLEQVLQVTLQIENERDRASVLAALASQLPDKLVERTLEEALQIEDEWSRVVVLKALVPQLPGKLLEQVTEAALQIKKAGARLQVLEALVSRTSEERHGLVLEQALQAALDAKGPEWLVDLAPLLSKEQREMALEQALQTVLYGDTWQFIRLLEALAPQLSHDLLKQAIQIGKQIHDQWKQTELLVVLAPHLSGDLLDQALDMTSQIKDEEKQTKALVVLAPRLPKALLERVLEMPRLVGIEKERAKIIITLAPQVPEEHRRMLLKQVVEDALQIQDVRQQTQVLVALTRQLPKEEAVEVLQQIKEEWGQVEGLKMLAPQLSGNLLKRVLGIAIQIGYDGNRGEALAILAPQLSGKLLERALEAALQIQDTRGRTKALRALAPQVSEERRNMVLEQAWQAALQIQDEGFEFVLDSRTSELKAIAEQLPQEVLPQALQAALRVKRRDSFAPFITDLHLSQEPLDQSIEDDLQRGNLWDRVEGIRALAPRLDRELLDQATQFMLRIQDAWVRARGLIALASQVPEVDRGSILQQALQSVQQIQSASSQAQELRELIPLLSGKLLEQALQIIQLMDIESERNILLAILAPRVPELQRRSTLEKALESTVFTRQLWARELVLTALVPLLPKGDYKLALEQTLQTALSMNDERGQDDLLELLALHLFEEHLEQALQATLQIKDQLQRAKVLKILIPQVPQGYHNQVLEQALQATLQIKDERERLWVLTVYLPFTSDHTLILQKTRQTLVDMLSRLRSKSWQDFSDSSLFNIISAHSIFSSETLNEIANALIEISNWQWL